METLDNIANTAKYASTDLLKSSYVDLGILVDVSTSMSGIINAVADSIDAVSTKIESANIELRLGLAEMGVDNIDNVFKTADFGDSKSTFDAAVNNLKSMNYTVLTDPYSSIIQVSSADNDISGQYEEDAFSWREGAAKSFSPLFKIPTEKSLWRLF